MNFIESLQTHYEDSNARGFSTAVSFVHISKFYETFLLILSQ